MAEFEVTYEADDGYVGKSRPKNFTIDEMDLSGDETREELVEMFEEIMYEDFQQNVQPFSDDCDEFVEWALKINKENEE